MECCKKLFGPKTFNKISHVTVLSWIPIGIIFLGIFAHMENTEFKSDFHCDGPESENVYFDVGRCFDKYETQYNKYSVPTTGFVITNFLFIGIVCIMYTQVVRTTIDQLSQSTRDDDLERLSRDGENPKSTGYQLCIAYCCQLSTRLVLGALFMILQTQVLYPSEFSFKFDCNVTAVVTSQPVNPSDANQSFTLYDCNNQQASKKTFWLYGVLVVNGIFVLFILVEIIYILARALKEWSFLQNSNFLKAHLNPSRGKLHEKPKKPKGKNKHETFPLQPREPEHLPTQGEQKEGGDEHGTVLPQPEEHEGQPPQCELNEKPEQKEVGEEHENDPLQPGEHEGQPSQVELNEKPEQKEGGKEHETVPGEHERQPPRGELNEKPERKDGRQEHETATPQSVEHERQLPQGELHDKPEQKQGEEEHETVPGEHEGQPSQGPLNETPEQTEGGDEHEIAPLQPGEHEVQPSQGELNEKPERKEGREEHETVPGEHEGQSSQGGLKERPEQTEGGDEHETAPQQPGELEGQPSQGKLDEKSDQREGEDKT